MPKTQTPKASAPEQMPVIYDVRIFGAKDSGTQRATATVDINGVFAVRGVKVLESGNGLFVAMPRFKLGNEYKDICFPCTKESREQFNAAVMSAYEQRWNRSRRRPIPPSSRPRLCPASPCNHKNNFGGIYIMKKLINTIKTAIHNAAFAVQTKVRSLVSRSRTFTRHALAGSPGEGYIDTAIKFLIAVCAGRAAAVHLV
jgi:stage V sporulation protein G